MIEQYKKRLDIYRGKKLSVEDSMSVFLLCEELIKELELAANNKVILEKLEEIKKRVDEQPKIIYVKEPNQYPYVQPTFPNPPYEIPTFPQHPWEEPLKITCQQPENKTDTTEFKIKEEHLSFVGHPWSKGSPLPDSITGPKTY